MNFLLGVHIGTVPLVAMVSIEPRVLSSKAPKIRISIAGRIDDRGYQMCRVIGRSLVDANTHVTLDLVPLQETQWEEFVRATASVRPPSHVAVWLHPGGRTPR